ncbi:MAG: hypothetical protein PHV47_00850 [Candidatus Pacebacteria bacterium]|nr:hypothetical protein [Candidatus Paceibacterota bacterium]MDD5621442.1 hypothetical protein [Candidatus Paceibacterota bacterium]
MQVFEYKFNTNIDKDIKLKIFSFRPDSSKLHLGEILILAEEINYLPTDQNLLENLAETIKEEFYSDRNRSSEIAFKESLKKANLFLSERSKSGDVNWLGNLNIAVLNFGNFLLNYTKAGTIRILLSRSDELKDLGQDIDNHGMGSTIRFFSNMSSGRLVLNDKIILCTQQLFEQLYDDVLPEIIYLNQVNDKNIKNIFSKYRNDSKNWSGIFILSFLKRKKIQFVFPFRINKLIVLIILLILSLLIAFFIFKR